MNTYYVSIQQHVVAVSTYVAEVEAGSPEEASLKARRMAEDGDFDDDWNFVGHCSPQVVVTDVEEE